MRTASWLELVAVCVKSCLGNVLGIRDMYRTEHGILIHSAWVWSRMWGEAKT